MDYDQIGIALLVVLFLLISLGMILVVLIQRPQGGGLSGAFGAGGGSGGQSAFGARTGDALTISTIVVFVAFLGIAIGLNFALRPSETSTQPVAGPADSEQTSSQPAPQPGTPAERSEEPDAATETGDAPGFPEPQRTDSPADPGGENNDTEPSGG